MDPKHYLPFDLAGPTASFVSVVGFGVFALLGLVLFAAALEYRHRRNAALARAALRTGSLTRAGYAGVRGRVEADPTQAKLDSARESNAVAAVEMAQYGRQIYQNGVPIQVWTEFARKVSARPFYLVTEQGDRVRVEPDANLALTDAGVGTTARLNRFTRERRVELKPGDEVYVLGEAVEGFDPTGANVAAGYRGGARGLVLRAPSRRPLVVSREKPEDRHARREGFHGRWALGLAVAMVFLQLGLFGQYHLLAFTGRVLWGQDAWVEQRARSNSAVPRVLRGPSSEYVVHAHYPTRTGDLALDARTSFDVFDGVNSGLTRVPFLVSVRAPNVFQLGRAPVVPRKHAVFAVFAASLLAVAYAVSTRRTRAWYDRGRQVDEVYGAL